MTHNQVLKFFIFHLVGSFPLPHSLYLVHIQNPGVEFFFSPPSMSSPTQELLVVALGLGSEKFKKKKERDKRV